ncbi:hypothetical protein Cni_G03095 [Canna indica]|uniref:histone acetyltransferase n=1 Tax=Canna indica TaxID=4628 RepID=A0AAQ3JRW7_9LILI|nr:hypothetical protein Cni_G03095 [Canna indica]
MNAHAHLPGQISSQMSSQVSGPPQQIGNHLASQMQNLGPRPVHYELQDVRNTMRQKIYNIIQRSRNQPFPDEFVPRILEIVKRLEERIYKDFAPRDEYLNLASEPVENRLFPIIKNLLNQNRQSLSHNSTAPSSVGTMIPTPGILNSGSTNSAASMQPDNPTITASNSAIASQTTANTGNLISTANASNDAGNGGSFNPSFVPSGYQHQSSSYALGSGGSSVMPSVALTNMPRQFSQMIPTPGFNTQSASSEFPNGAGFSSSDTTVAHQPVQQKKYVANQTNGGQIGAGIRSSVLHKGSPYGFSNGIANGTRGLIGNNMQLGRPTASEGFLGPASFANPPRPLHNNSDQQHHQSRIPTSLSQQMSSMSDDGYTVKTTDMTCSGPDSSGISAMTNMHSVDLLPSRTNSGLLNHHARLQSMRLPSDIRSQLLDRSEKLSYQSSQSTSEHLLQSQQHAQQSPQQLNQSYAQFVHNQHQLLQRHQQSIQNQQLMTKADSLTKSSMTSHFGEQLMPGNANAPYSESLIQSSVPQVQLPELQTQFQQNSSAEDHAKSTQCFGQLPSSQDLHVLVSEGSQPSLNAHLQSDGFPDKYGHLSVGSRAEESLQFQWQHQPLQTQMSDKFSSQQLQEKLERPIGKDEAQRGDLSAREVDSGYEDSIKKQNYLKQMRWLLFLHHARRCPAPKGLCKEVNCLKAQELVMHMDICNSMQCKFPRCSQSRKLLGHISNCQSADCPVCIPVRNRISANYKTCADGMRKGAMPTENSGRQSVLQTKHVNTQHISNYETCSRALSDTGAATEIKTVADGMRKDVIPTESFECRQPVTMNIKVQDISNSKTCAHTLSDTGIVTEIKTIADGTKRDTMLTEDYEETQSAAKHMKVQHIPNYKTCAQFLSDTSVATETKRVDGLRKHNMSTENSEERQSVTKRMKVQHLSPFSPKNDSSLVGVPSGNQLSGFQEADSLDCKQTNMEISVKTEVIVKTDEPSGSRQGKVPLFGSDSNGAMSLQSCEKDAIVSTSINSHVKREGILVDNVLDRSVSDIKKDADPSSTDQVTGSKSGKPKIKGVSLTELFTPEQIKEHIIGLRQWIGQSKAKAEKNQAMEHSMTENSCQLCAVEKLTFEPPPIYCSPCGARIKRNALYYTIGSGETRHYFCIPCYNEARGDTIEAEGSRFLKARLEKKRNDEETEEWWVQCDKCESWQHQICALFNGRRNDGEAEYTCPNCYVKEIEIGERKPLPQNAVLGAKDLPRTILSDHIEQRLFKRLKQERQERARHLAKSFDEVPGVEGLVIRVVSSVDKKLEVKQRFLEIFQEENYPKEFPYKSKVVLLFQKIEGVEVCLFGMYVQEFGSECAFPNQRRVYLSYLDSVKYFRPEIKTMNGEALRTFVYHEILIGYLEYCKKRGFTSCYIWACPPLKGEDYILYCHPEIQKTPKSDKLREWYLNMLRKASKENIVVDLTNLYDHFFVTMGECKAKITAARLPYFDGDYWPGAAEDMIHQLRQEEDGSKQLKKGTTKKTITKRALKASGHANLSGKASKDALLMHKLGETICPMKEDFIMVHLQHACTHCCVLMVSGTRWVCHQCKNFQLCDKCHEAEQRVEERHKHPTNSREKHMLYPVQINDVAQDTKDKDEILESEFFDTRQAFLSLCQGNHYQYDTLRRAKHSSMMILYHLHNPTAPAFVITCVVCHHDIEAGLGWRCESCPDFDVCNACYQKGGIDHPHKLTNNPSMADHDAQNKEARARRVLELKKMLDLLIHASQCRFPHCQYPNCRKVKSLFCHGIQCKTRASGGCVLCKKMWYLLKLHSCNCKESECRVPRCRDLREHARRLQQQSESRRRAAVMEMMRQRAAEVATSAG